MRKAVFLFSFLSLLSLWACGPRQSDMMVGGIQINEPDLDHWVSSLKDAGMNTVEVTVYGRNGDWNNEWMKFEEEEPFVLQEIRAAKREGLKVVLVLRMALDHYYPANKFLWHGMIFPETENQVHAWFERYAAFVQKWAQIAEQEKVDVLAIGSELNALAATQPTDTLPETVEWFGDSAKLLHWEERVLKYKDQLREKDLWVRGFPNYDSPREFIRDKVKAHWQWAQTAGFGLDSTSLDQINLRRKLLLGEWKGVIREARSRYGGKLTFAANFDNYREVAFWDELDFIGINAYFPLRKVEEGKNRSAVNRAKLKESWHSIFAEIDSFRVRKGLPDKPIFFTELGYTYRKNATLRPWQADGFSVIGKGENEHLVIWPRQAVDRTERTQAVRALYEAVEESRFPLAGILYWKLTSIPELVEIEPFAMHIAKNPSDSMQTELNRFLELPRSEEPLMGSLSFD